MRNCLNFIFNVNHFFQVARLESQVIRYKSAAETSEKVEDELKVEKRKLQREVCFIKFVIELHYVKFCL